MVQVPKYDFGSRPVSSPATYAPQYQRSDFATPEAFGAGVGRAMQEFGGSISKLGDVAHKAAMEYAQREKQVKDFDTLTRFNQFNEQMTQTQAELFRNTPANGMGVLQSSTKTYDEQAEKFFQTVPKAEQPQYAARLAELRGRYSGRALQHQFETQDKFFKTGITDQMSKDQIYLDQDPEQLELRQKAMDEMIDKSGLPQAEKEEYKALARKSLQMGAYKGIQRRDPKGAAKALGVGEAGDIDTVVDKVIGAESGGNASARSSSSSATGAGQFIDSTWLNLMRKYKPDMIAGMSKEQILNLRFDGKLSREMVGHNLEEGADALRASGHPITAGNLYLTHFAGNGGANAILSSDPTKSISLILSPDAMAANSFLAGKTAGDVIAWADKKMGQPGATIQPRGDKRFADIPYEQRVALTKDALQADRAADAQLRQQAQTIHNNQMNELLLGIHDGTLGRADIITARQSWMKDFTDVERADNALKQYQEKVGSLSDAINWLQKPDFVADPTDASNKKRVDALFDAGDGAKKIYSNDQGFLKEGLFPLIDKTKMIPGNAVGTLIGMLRDQSKINDAMTIMDQMERLSPGGFSAAFDADTTKKLLSWRSLKDYYPPNELAKRMTESVDPQARKARETMRKEGLDLAADISDSTILDGFDPSVWTPGPDAPVKPETNAVMRQEFNQLFAEQFSEVGDKDIATANTIKLLQKTWGPNSLGGDNRLMKYPPTGTSDGRRYYPTISGSYDWMKRQSDQQVREAILSDKLMPGLVKPPKDFTAIDALSGLDTVKQDFPLPQYWLQPDPQTEAEINQGKPPGYQVIVKDEFGRFMALQNKNGKPVRMNFDPTADSIKHQTELVKQANERKEAERLYRGNPFKPQRGPDAD